jgi:hypothetical protein
LSWHYFAAVACTTPTLCGVGREWM